MDKIHDVFAVLLSVLSYSGGGPEVVKIAKDLIKEWGGNPERDVVAIATLPEALTEGNRVCHNALTPIKRK